MGLHEEAILARDAVAFDDFGCPAGDIGHAGQFVSGRPDADDSAQRVAERPRVELGVITAYDPALLEPLEPLAHGGSGQADAPPEFGEAAPGIVLELR